MCFVIPPEQMSLFSIDTFEERLQRYLQETFHVNLIYERSTSKNEKSKEAKGNIRMKITGQMIDADNAMQDVNDLFRSFCSKKFTGKRSFNE